MNIGGKSSSESEGIENGGSRFAPIFGALSVIILLILVVFIADPLFSGGEAENRTLNEASEDSHLNFFIRYGIGLVGITAALFIFLLSSRQGVVAAIALVAVILISTPWSNYAGINPYVETAVKTVDDADDVDPSAAVPLGDLVSEGDDSPLIYANLPPLTLQAEPKRQSLNITENNLRDRFKLELKKGNGNRLIQIDAFSLDEADDLRLRLFAYYSDQEQQWQEASENDDGGYNEKGARFFSLFFEGYWAVEPTAWDFPVSGPAFIQAVDKSPSDETIEATVDASEENAPLTIKFRPEREDDKGEWRWIRIDATDKLFGSNVRKGVAEIENCVAIQTEIGSDNPNFEPLIALFSEDDDGNLDRWLIDSADLKGDFRVEFTPAEMPWRSYYLYVGQQLFDYPEAPQSGSVLVKVEKRKLNEAGECPSSVPSANASNDTERMLVDLEKVTKSNKFENFIAD